ncbi:DUF1353 domain-containing protein [Candidatus Desantisbacteria bacterium]|nr:DUF1353 domain-containing protein [Candidatus Desantisbacteria bacterium]
MSRFTAILLVSPLADGKTWVIRSEFGYDIGVERSRNQIDVPIGFKTDFASVPRLFWVLLPRWGKYGNAAVIHDYLYWSQEKSRRESDNIFLEAMGVLQVSTLQKNLMYWAVRWFGWWAWNNRRRHRGIQWVASTMPQKSVEVP